MVGRGGNVAVSGEQVSPGLAGRGAILLANEGEAAITVTDETAGQLRVSLLTQPAHSSTPAQEVESYLVSARRSGDWLFANLQLDGSSHGYRCSRHR